MLVKWEDLVGSPTFKISDNEEITPNRDLGGSTKLFQMGQVG